MAKNGHLNGYIDQIELDVVERAATPSFLMKLSIRLYLAELPHLNTVYFIEVFGIERARSTVHN